MQELIKAVKDHATANYATWGNIIEHYGDSNIRNVLEAAQATTPEQAIEAMTPYARQTEGE